MKQKILMTLALLITAVGGAWAADTYTITFKANNKTKTIENVTLPHTFTSVNNQGNGELDLIINDLYNQSEGWCVEIPTVSGNSNVTAGLEDGSYNQYITISAPFEGNATVSGSHFYNNPISSFTYTLEISIPGYIDGPAVTINTAKTTASFEMPASDVDVSYELVRDMSVQMQAQVGDDPAKQPRYRVQWNGERWIPADMNVEQVLALFSVNDLIENTTLDPENYLVSIYAIDTEGNPTGDAMNFKTFTFAPGRYCVTASPNTLLEEPVPYEGTTAPSNIFELIQGYEVTVPAGEYATFYKDEKLYVEDEDAELYTIANVSTTEAVLSEKMEVAPAETPLLVYNAGSETKTFLLMPTDDEASEVLVAAEFRGTLAAKDMPASSSTMDYYVCTGKAFTWVRDAGQIAANRCWLQIGSGNQPAGTRASSRAITRGIGGIDGTTGIDAVDNGEVTNEGYYDLQGRKVQNPKRGGIYIHNGKKVIKH